MHKMEPIVLPIYTSGLGCCEQFADPLPFSTITHALRFPWTSLVAQWLRICLPTQGMWVQSLGQKDSTCYRQLSPRTTTTEARKLHSPCSAKRRHRNESPHTTARKQPRSPPRENDRTQQRRPSTV